MLGVQLLVNHQLLERATVHTHHRAACMGDSAGCESFAERKDLKWMICSVLRMLLKSMRMIRGTHFFRPYLKLCILLPSAPGCG